MFNTPVEEIERLNESCALDLAERGGMTLEECGQVLRLNRERVRQIEAGALAEMKPVLAAGGGE